MYSSKDSTDSVEKDVEEFVNYLEQNNVVDQITNVFIMLYNESERPSDPIEYVRKNLNPDNSDIREIAEIKSLLESARVEMDECLRVRNELVTKLEQLKSNEDNIEEEEVGTPTDFDVEGNLNDKS